MSLVVQQNSLIPSQHEMTVFQTMAAQAVSSKMYKGVGDEAGILMIMLTARELQVPAMQALNGGINIIQGKVELSARLMNALMRRAGVRISIKESTDASCTLYAKRVDTGDEATVSYTLVDAQKAGLVKPTGGWTKNPKDMCFARAISRLARQIAPDVIGACYIEGEIKASDAEVILPEEIPQHSPESESVENLEKEKQNQEKLIELFDKEDKFLILDYIDVVSKHYGWSWHKTVKVFINDTQSLITKFNAWKAKKAL